MRGVNVEGEELVFTPEYTLECAVLSHGAKEGRKLLKKLRKKLSPSDRKASEMMDEIPVIVPTTREETYERAYAMIREAGRCVGEELRRMECPTSERDMLEGAFMDGVLNVGLGAESRSDRHIGVAKLFHSCGVLTANILMSVFPEREGEPEPDYDAPFAAFWHGVADEAGGEWDE
jgi:hypothetical protein